MSMRMLMSYDGYYPGSAGFFDFFCRYGCSRMAIAFPEYDRPLFGNGYPLVPGGTGDINSYTSVVDPNLTVSNDDAPKPRQEDILALFNVQDIIEVVDDPESNDDDDVYNYLTDSLRN
eukprot:GHVH01017474.1.p1 GENE.GHVH01017474.1~~GHVH01017474.1.p1  ORF type:complete len:118 (-),score=15.41 GHVH01017474.1:23-376(-)